jgi:hypothetical protein
MGAWGVQPTDNDSFADRWAEIVETVNKICAKQWRFAQRDPDEKWAAIGVVVSMADAGIPIDKENYDHAVTGIDAILADENFTQSWRKPSEFVASAKAVRAKIKRLEGKPEKGPGYGLMGGRAGAVRGGR